MTHLQQILCRHPHFTKCADEDVEHFANVQALMFMLRQRCRYDLEMQRLVLGEKIIRDVATLGDMCRIFELRPGHQLRVQLILAGPTELDT